MPGSKKEADLGTEAVASADRRLVGKRGLFYGVRKQFRKREGVGLRAGEHANGGVSWHSSGLRHIILEG